MTPSPHQPTQHNEELVRLALETIDRGAALKTKVEWAVEYVQQMKATKKSAWSYSLRHGVLTKQHRDSAKRIAAALRTLKFALKPLETDRGLRIRLQLETAPAEFIDFPMTRSAIEKWEKHAQQIADTKLRAASRFDARKMVAVQQAAILLETVGLRLNRTRHGKFDQLAAILYGTPDTDFLHYLSEFVKLRATRARPQRNGR